MFKQFHQDSLRLDFNLPLQFIWFRTCSLFPETQSHCSLDLNLNPVVILFAQGVKSWVGVPILIYFPGTTLHMLTWTFDCLVLFILIRMCPNLICLNTLFFMLDFTKLLGTSLHWDRLVVYISWFPCSPPTIWVSSRLKLSQSLPPLPNVF